MSRSIWFKPRVVVLSLLWILPILVCIGFAAVALYQTGWIYWLLWSLPPIWLAAWLVGLLWPAAKLKDSTERPPWKAPAFWTPQDAAAIEIVEEFRSGVQEIDNVSIADYQRYVSDAKGLSARLAKHYHSDGDEDLLQPLTLVEILAVIHLAVEDLEQWMIENIPGSGIATLGQLKRVPGYVDTLDKVQKLIYIGSAIFNPTKLIAYPLWRKSGRVAVELQNELMRRFYQRYLQQLGYYLIEMYSGRLRGGSKQYRSQFGPMAAAAHAVGGNVDSFASLQDVPTTIAVLGQVKAGKSSLINALMQDQVATTSVLPETRQVKRYEYSLPDSENAIALLDTPGYSEADVTKQQQKEIRAAVEAADIVLLVMAANVSARDADVEIVRDLTEYYRSRKELKPPPIVAVITHIDLLRPVREWSPPYHWRKPKSQKEKSIAAAVSYIDELFGDTVADIACVHTAGNLSADSSVADEVVPLLITHLDHGHAAAILKAFHDRLSRDRFKRLAQQAIGLVKQITQ